MLADVRLDNATWGAASSARQADFRTSIEDLKEAVFAPSCEGAWLLVTREPERAATALEFLDEGGFVMQREQIDDGVLSDLVKEYVDIIGRLDREAGGGDTAHTLALDMAKKVVHDKAGRLLLARLPGVATELPTMRRLFTLILSLTVDTTALAHARGHRFAIR